MTGLRFVCSCIVLALILALAPSSALAQNAGIAGVVKDSSGLVMPGVTVEAASPALIEKVRTVVSDGQGLYSIVDLRPGTYTVTFTLAGFTTIRREGIELNGSFTATVNTELQVGAVQEALTVTGQVPTVDTRNVVQSTVLREEVREALPTGRNQLYMATLIPGTTRTANAGKVRDLAGTSDTRGSTMIHGGRSADYMLTYDGTPTDLGGGGNQSYQSDPGEVQELVYRLGALSAENSFGGVAANIIPKDGGNRFAGKSFFAWSGGHLQSDNVTQALIDVGVTANNNLKRHWDADVSAGGPIRHDRLWYFGSYRNNGQDEIIPGMFEAIDPRSFVFDPSKGVAGNVDPNKPAKYPTRNYYYSGRFTWQATPKNKFAFYLSDQARHNYGRSVTGTVAVEASQNQEWGHNPFNKSSCGGKEGGCGFEGMMQGTWRSPLTSRLLLEANVGYSPLHGCICVPFGEQAHSYAGPDVVAVNDTGTGYQYRASGSTYSPAQFYDHNSWKFAASYVTGGHAAKVGVDSDWGEIHSEGVFHNQNMTFTFKNGVPTGITVFNEPTTSSNGQWRRLGAFAQDQWTIKRVTINAGARFDYHHGKIPATQTTGPNAYALLQHWPGVNDVPKWKDISPRFGVAYDVFGNGKTAVKYTISRYVLNDGSSFPQSVNPLTFNSSATRSWTDTKACAGGVTNDFVPQECELGTLSNSAFGTAATTTTVDDAIRSGWGVRPYNWETSASVQHQLMPNLSVNFAFTRRWYGNFTATDNRALVPGDYDEFCITAPTDSRLGSASGSHICGLYDLNPAKRSLKPDNLKTSADKFGKQKEYWQGIDLTTSARIGGRVTLQGGLNSGTEGNRTEACFVIDSPGAMRFCNVKRPWRTNVRFLGNVELPWGISVGGTFVDDPNVEVLATYSVANADITSGLVQFVNPARTTFGSGSANVQLISPGTKFLDNIYQVDVRIAKTIQRGRFRGRVTLDLANLNNSSAVLAANNAFGTSWLRPNNVMPGRLIKPGVEFEW